MQDIVVSGDIKTFARASILIEQSLRRLKIILVACAVAGWAALFLSNQGPGILNDGELIVYTLVLIVGSILAPKFFKNKRAELTSEFDLWWQSNVIKDCTSEAERAEKIKERVRLEGQFRSAILD